MNSNSNKIIQIKDTIEEIRYDIKIMEKKNDTRIKSFLTSITPSQSSILLSDIPTLNDEATHDLIQKYNPNDMLLSYLPTSLSVSSHNKLNSTKSQINTYTYNYANSNNDKEEEATLNKLIKELQEQNRLLGESLIQKEQENAILLQKKGEEDIYATMQYLLEGQTIEELIDKIAPFQRGDKENSVRNKLVEKLRSLYIVLTGTNEEEEVNIITIWRWIKHLIRTVKEMANEKEATGQLEKEVDNTARYKEFCMQLIRENELGSIAELRGFVKDLYSKANIGEKRIDKLKKVVLLNPLMKLKEDEKTKSLLQ